HEPQAAPAIMKRSQVRPSPALVGPKRNRYFRHVRTQLLRLDHQFERELHPRSSGIDEFVNPPCKAAHTAVRIPNPSPKKTIQNGRDSRIAQVLVERRHCAGLDDS